MWVLSVYQALSPFGGPKYEASMVLVSSPDPPEIQCVRREREGLEHNPGWKYKCSEGRNSVTGVDWPQYRVFYRYIRSNGQ